MIKKRLTFLLLAATALTGCTTVSLEARHTAAVDIALPATMSERIIPAGMFNLTAFERVTQPGAAADVYIEGDGLAWLDAHTKSRNPTPPDPLALHLAAADKAANVIYIARPCQYTGWTRDDSCPDIYWSNGRTAPEVIAAYQQALDNIKAVHHVTGFNLTGYSGGAAVAVLAAAGRNDVLSLRTVAGNTNYALFTSLHNISPMDASVDPITVAAKLAKIPQQHFIGGADTVVPEAIFSSWQQASGGGGCVHSTVVPGVTHEKGWTERWAELLAIPVTCAEK